ncbi:MAG TPA: hypothetical protein VEL28_08205 [Candidatus Binatia bacterium]|nr:hypothetical protein [Candidatus Binatia bacterium]
MTLRNVVFTTGPYDGPARIRVDGETVQLRRKGEPEGRNPTRNTYTGEGVVVVSLATEAPYEACAEYPKPPTQGSCFTGSLTVRRNSAHTTIPVIQICGC